MNHFPHHSFVRKYYYKQFDSAGFHLSKEPNMKVPEQAQRLISFLQTSGSEQC